MKFGRYLEEHAVPEWSAKYLDYKKLKKYVTAIVNETPDVSRDHPKILEFDEMLRAEITKITAFYQQKETEALEFFERLQRFTAPLLGPNHTLETEENQLLSDEVELNEITSSSASVPPPPSESLAPPPPLPNSARLSASLSPDLDDDDDDEGEDEDKEDDRGGESTKDFQAVGRGADMNPSASESEIRKRKTSGKEEKHLHGSVSVPEKFAGFLHDQFHHGFHYSEHLISGIAQTIKHNKWTHESAEEHEKAKKRMAMAAALEFYRGLVLLKNYAVINYTAFVKILKKADKLTHLHFRTELMDLPFKTSSEVDRLMSTTEKIFGSSFLSGDLRKARRILRVPEVKADPTRAFIAGGFLGLNVALAALLIYVVSSNNTNVGPKIVYPRFQCPGITDSLDVGIRFGYFGLDENAYPLHVNYVFIFDMDPRWKLTHTHCFEAVMSLTLLWQIAIGIWTSAGTFPVAHPPPFWFPFMLGVIFLLLVINPIDIFFKKGRYWFINTLGRIASAPFKTVRFKDFFLGDQLTSMVLVLQQLQFLLCFYAHDAYIPDADATCFKIQPKISPYLSALPAIWRFLQCLRRYRDSKEKVHLKNAGKYSCTFYVVMFSTLDSFYGGKHWNVYRTFWLITVIFNAIYAYCWDILLDWSLIYINDWRTLNITVRKKRIYPYAAFYVWAAISNFFLRLTWSLTKSNLLQLATVVPWQLAVVVAAVEILRRGQWNLIRLENEHSNNCGKYRAVKEMQLPIN